MWTSTAPTPPSAGGWKEKPPKSFAVPGAEKVLGNGSHNPIAITTSSFILHHSPSGWCVIVNHCDAKAYNLKDLRPLGKGWGGTGSFPTLFLPWACWLGPLPLNGNVSSGQARGREAAFPGFLWTAVFTWVCLWEPTSEWEGRGSKRRGLRGLEALSFSPWSSLLKLTHIRIQRIKVVWEPWGPAQLGCYSLPRVINIRLEDKTYYVTFGDESYDFYF